MSTSRYLIESYADDPGRFYVYTVEPDGYETIHAENLPSREAAQDEARQLETFAAALELLDALAGLLRRYPEGPDTGRPYTPEGARARELLARLTGWTS